MLNLEKNEAIEDFTGETIITTHHKIVIRLIESVSILEGQMLITIDRFKRFDKDINYTTSLSRMVIDANIIANTPIEEYLTKDGSPFLPESVRVRDASNRFSLKRTMREREVRRLKYEKLEEDRIEHIKWGIESRVDNIAKLKKEIKELKKEIGL